MDKFLKLFDSNPKVKRLLLDYSDQIKKIAIIGILVVGLFAVFIITNDKGTNPIPEEASAKAETTVSTNIFVDIGGEVVNPMLAELPEGSRVENAIQLAGGLTENADLTSINRAEFLEDGEKIFIPAKIEGDSVSADTQVPVTDTAAAASSNGKVNINTADSAGLQTLNGVGPSTAQKIIDYRTSSGRFKTIEDLKNVSGIGDKTFEKLKDYICV